MKKLKTVKTTSQRTLGVSVFIFTTFVLSFITGCGSETSEKARLSKPSYSSELSAQSNQKEDFFYSNGQKYPVTVSLNSLGLLAREAVSAKHVEALGDALKLELIRELPGNIFILGLEESLSREKLVDLAREVKRRGERIVARAGLVVTPIGAEIPLIAGDELVVQFRADVDKEQIKSLNQANAVEIVMENPFVTNQFRLKVTAESGIDVLKMANRYHEDKLTKFAHPNFVRVIDLRQFIPNDPLFGDQWHHRNTGQSGGTVDADIDAELAWDITLGDPGVVIAVIDNGPDLNHPDTVPNLWVNPSEIPGNGVDDDDWDADPTTYIDDISGWDFNGNDNDPTGGNHGTAVAGTAAATGDNALGVTGSCPNCSLMLIRFGATFNDDALAFGYAQQMGADIITNSWGYSIGTPATTDVVNAINVAAGAGCVIFFAMSNRNINDCTGATPDISSMANVVAVSAVSNQDRKVTESAFGNCMDLLAPTHRGYGPNPNGWPAGSGSAYTGTLNIATTDRVGNNGYNNADPPNAEPGFSPDYCPGETADRDYTLCFGGTSAATPLTAGVTGLVLSANPDLTSVQVQRLLQDTADKVEDSAGDYAEETGFSTPATGDATHGWGRVNAFEAVRIAAPVVDGGKEGVDIFLRDNRLDWGNTEQPSNTLFEPTRGFIGHWRSMSIKVDAPPYQTAPTAATFDAFTDETPSAASGDINRVYVRVRNRGPVTANSVTVKLHWTQFGTALPALPADFWTAFPVNSTNTTQWHPLNCAGTSSPTCTINNLAYSGSSVAGTGADAAQIVQFDFPAPPVDPTLDNHFCLLAMIDSSQDRILPLSRATIPNDFVADILTPTDNNITHRNYTNLSTTRTTRFMKRFFVRNPWQEAAKGRLKIKGPIGWPIVLDGLEPDEPFELKPNQEIPVTIKVTLPQPNLTGEVTIIQERVDVDPPKVMGGVTFRFRGEEKVSTFVPCDGVLSPYLTGTFDLRDERRTILHIINPTAKHLRVIVAFFDDKEKPLKCVRDSLSPNDLLEIDVRKYVREKMFGVVKVVSLNGKEDTPEVGIVGYQSHFFKKRWLFFFKQETGATETVLHPIPTEILKDDIKNIWRVCK